MGTNAPQRTPPGPPRPGEPQKDTSPGRWMMVVSIVWWLVMAGILIWNGATLFSLKPSPPVAMAYSDFVLQVRAGLVASIVVSGQAVEGTFRQPTVWPPATPGTEGQATSEPTPVTHFTTILPPFEDPTLLPLLAQYGVGVTVRDTANATHLLDLALGLLPVLLLIGGLVLIGRQAQRGQQSLFGFGGSRARVYDAEHPTVTLSDVAGAEEAKAEVEEIVSFLREPARYRALGARLPRGVLLLGPPGTGKTLLARAVAGEAGVPFFSISASEFVEMFVGVGASRVRDLFAKAKSSAPAIVFVDELDAVGRQRGAGLGGGHDEREQTLNQLLVEMDGFDDQTNVIVLAATNRPDVLDPALLRPGRFDRQVTLGLPDRAGRQAILRIHTRRLPLAPEVALESLAARSPGFSGADLANLANEAALAAARRGTSQVAMEDFDVAMDKLVLGTRQASLMSEDERRLVAYHEGGHVIVAKLTPGADPVTKVTIIPHGRALGVTEQFPIEERHTYTRDYLLGRLAVLLGGRAAEELVFGQPTTGAEADLKQATALTRRMVGLWGMSPDIGPVSYGIGETHPFLGRELTQPRDFAEATGSLLDQATRTLIEEAHQTASDTLAAHRPALDRLAAELLARETVDGQRIDALLTEPIAPAPTTRLRSA